MATEEDAIDEFLIISYITLEDLEVKILFCFYFCFGGSALVFINFVKAFNINTKKNIF